MVEENNNRVAHWNCSCCGKPITHLGEAENEVYADRHFDIERSTKDLYIEDNSIEELIEKRNVAMDRKICESCFGTIVSESPTLRKTFQYGDKILY